MQRNCNSSFTPIHEEFYFKHQKCVAIRTPILTIHAPFVSQNALYLEALNKAGYNSKTAKKVMIQSSDSSVLAKFKGKNYELVYHVNEIISDILNSTILDIKNFSDSVLIGKKSVYPDDENFTTGVTNIVPKLQSFKLHVYVELFRNEFVSQDWDFFSDPIVEINQFVTVATVDGLVTDFPQTAASYKKNRCLNSANLSPFLSAVLPGGLLQSMAFVAGPAAVPPAEPPAPVFTDADVSEPALPPAVKIVPSPAPSTTTASSPKTPSSDVPRITFSAFLSSLAMVAAALLLF